MPAAVPAHRTYAFALFYAETQICECRLTPMGGAFLRRWAPPQSVRHASDLPPLISNAGSLATFVAMRRGSSAESRPAAFRRRRRSRRRRRASISAPSSAPAEPMATSSLMRSPTLTARSLEGSRRQVSHRGGRITVGFAGVVNGISPEHAAFLNDGGLGIVAGDGQLPNPGPEETIEAYYSYALTASTRISADYQLVVNPAYATERGLVNIFAWRFLSQF